MEKIIVSKRLMDKALACMRNWDYENAISRSLEAYDALEALENQEAYAQERYILDQMRGFGHIQNLLTSFRDVEEGIQDTYPELLKKIKDCIEKTLSEELTWDIGISVLHRRFCGEEGPLRRDEIAKTMLDIGRVYHSEDNMEKAQYWQKQGLEFLGEDDEDVSSDFCGRIAGIYMDSEAYETAIRWLTRALECIEADPEADGQDLIWCLTDLESAYEKNGQMEDAIVQCERIIEEYKKHHYKPENLRKWYEKLGEFYTTFGRYDEAVKSYQACMELDAHSDIDEYAWHLCCLADNLDIQKKYDEAEIFYKRILEIFKQEKYFQDDIDEILKKLINIYEETGRHSEAKLLENQLTKTINDFLDLTIEDD